MLIIVHQVLFNLLHDLRISGDEDSHRLLDDLELFMYCLKTF